MRIGIVPDLRGFAGGLYQYSLTMLRTLYEWRSDGCEDEFIVFAPEIHHAVVPRRKGSSWTIKPLNQPSLKRQALGAVGRIIGEGPHREAWRRIKQQLHGKKGGPGSMPDPDSVQYRPEMNSWFRSCGTELMLYPAPKALSFETGIPYVIAIHDLQHRLQPEFPEVSANGEWEWREYLFRNGTRYATIILADSEVGREDILDLYGQYGIAPDRVKVLPYLPACYLAVDVSESQKQRVRATYHLPERYLFYPAQFWPHKNHVRILHALAMLKQEHRTEVSMVFCGSHADGIRKRTFDEVISLSRQLGLGDQIRYLGYIPDEDMAALYAGGVGLVMPTFFGPTNIPILEAWAFGCPVLTSDIRGVREQAGDAAILVDPRSVEAIADGMYRLWTDEDLRSTLANRGEQRLAAYAPDEYRRRLMGILEEARARVRLQKPKTVNGRTRPREDHLYGIR